MFGPFTTVCLRFDPYNKLSQPQMNDEIWKLKFKDIKGYRKMY